MGKIVECRKTFSDEKSLKANRFRMRFCIELQRCAKSETNPSKKKPNKVIGLPIRERWSPVAKGSVFLDEAGGGLKQQCNNTETTTAGRRSSWKGKICDSHVAFFLSAYAKRRVGGVSSRPVHATHDDPAKRRGNTKTLLWRCSSVGMGSFFLSSSFPIFSLLSFSLFSLRA